MTARTAIAGAAVLAVCLAACGRQSYRPNEHPPATRVERTTETLHGVAVSDDYRWLEGGPSPNGVSPGPVPADVAAWTDAQRQYTRRVLDQVPGRGAVATRLSALMDVGDVSLPLISGNRYFFWVRNPGEPLPTVYMREGALGSDRPVLRPTDLDPKGVTAARWIMPSPDGRWLAFGAAAAGATEGTLRLLDVNADRMAPLEIRGSPRAVYWLPDSSGFIYQRQDADDPNGTVVRFHRLGEDPERDQLVRRQAHAVGQAAGTPDSFVSLSRDGRWLIVGEWTSPESNDLWLISFDDIRRRAPAPARVVTTGLPGRAVATVVGDTLFIQTTKGAPNGRVVAADLSRPGAQHWRDVVPERADATITDVAFGGGLMAVTYLEHASNVTEVFDRTGRPVGRLAQPGIGMTSLAASEEGTAAFMLFQSYNRPPTIFRVDLQKPAEHAVQWKAPVLPVDPEAVSVERVRYRSKDGTEVSMFVVRRRDLTPDGALPTLLAGYGAFGATMTPAFTAHWSQWFEAGGVLAIAHVRGGGEYGPPWHANGARERKMNSFDDFIAAAEWLIAEHYTNPDKLAVYGGAAGGLLAGGALVMRPDLFRAGVLVSPILDMLRYDRFPPGAAWTGEFGAPADPAAFAWLSAYSPYQHVKPGTSYPGILLTGSETEGGIDPMHVRKMAARLQAATSSDPAERPVLLWVGKTSDSTSAEARALQALVDERVFLMWQLGMPLPE